MANICRILVFFILALAAQASFARQNPAEIKKAVEDFVLAQTAGQGEVSVKVGKIDSNLDLPECKTLEAFSAPGARLIGNTTVGVRCGSQWSLYLPVKIAIMSEIVVSARPLPAGTIIALTDVMTRKSDLSLTLPGTLTDPAEAVGKSLASSIPASYPLRIEMLRAPILIRQGQSVKLISKGHGFQISSEGIAMGQAAEGQTLQVKTPSGQIVNGVVKPGPIVEVPF